MNSSSASTSGRPYQGYPYVNPFVNDVPSVDPETAAKWTNLPRRPIGRPERRPDRQDSEVAGSSSSGRTEDIRPSRPTNKEDEPAPVIYIDLPETDNSGVVQRENQTQNGFIQETILYDPFKNKRIDLGQQTNEELSITEDGPSMNWQGPATPARPIRPNNLDLSSPGSSSGYASSQGTSSTPGVPNFLSKQPALYGSSPADVLPTPIPASEFPEPPPAYTEVDVRTPQPSVPSPESQSPRTQVILPSDVTEQSRKYLHCHNCSQRVHSIVIRESGMITHVLAILFLIVCPPMTIVVYCTKYFKNKNHYCTACNRLIGYELPWDCKEKLYYSNNKCNL